MSKIKVSHEVPRCLLNASTVFNDYSYCLPHLLDQDEEYLKFFLNEKKEGRYIVMDNSLHELGEAYNWDRLMHWVNEIKPNEFIIPDVWCDKDQSIKNAVEWKSIDLPKGVEKVAVVQANTIHEASVCYETYKKLGYTKIAFSYGADYYNDVVPLPNKSLGKALGRISVISALIKTGVIKQTDRIHLLGCSVPQEFRWYHNLNCIESIDTSNPVMAALENISYTTSGLDTKPKANMNDFYDIPLDSVDLNLLSRNVYLFKEINNI